jgi:hypothetical protein
MANTILILLLEKITNSITEHPEFWKINDPTTIGNSYTLKYIPQDWISLRFLINTNNEISIIGLYINSSRFEIPHNSLEHTLSSRIEELYLNKKKKEDKERMEREDNNLKQALNIL